MSPHHSTPLGTRTTTLGAVARLSDGDTIAITAATQPSIEDLILGAIPGIPRIRLYKPVLAYENGDDFLAIWRRTAAGEIAVHDGGNRPGSAPSRPAGPAERWGLRGDTPYVPVSPVFEGPDRADLDKLSLWHTQ